MPSNPPAFRSAAEAPALDRGLALIEWLAQQAEAVGFNRINAAMELNPATTARLLRTLMARDYVVKTEAGGYRLGPAIRGLTTPEEPRQRFTRALEPVLEHLREVTGNSAIGFWWSGRHTISEAKRVHPEAPAMQPVGRMSHTLRGGPWMLVALAELSSDERAELAASYEEDATELETQARQAHQELTKRGFVLDVHGAGKHVRRMAAGVRGPDGALVGMIGLGGTLGSMPDDRIDAIGRRLVDACWTLSAAVGGPKTPPPTKTT